MMNRLLVLSLGLLLSATAVAETPPGNTDGPGAHQERGERRHRGRGMSEERMKEREAELIARIREMDSDIASKLEQLKVANPSMYKKLLMQSHRSLRDSADSEAALKRFVRMVTLLVDIQAAVVDFDEQSTKVQKQRRAEVVALANELFELRQAERQVRLAQMQARLAKVQQEIAEREADKADIVNDFVDEAIDRKRPGF